MTNFTRPAAVLLALACILGAAPAYCAHCFVPAATLQAHSANHQTDAAAARCRCNSLASSVHKHLNFTVNTTETQHQPAPFTGAVVALLDSPVSGATPHVRTEPANFRPPSRVLNYGVRLE